MDQFLKLSVVCNTLSISKATLYRWVNEGKLIKPIQLGANTSVIRKSELIEYMNRIVRGDTREEVTRDIEQARTQIPR
ncbi:helix-turn-helix domain-containing protein [Vibrio maerlii]|uniref:helix-turn-helix transcriptional regulator n=1 Tax=Vibrio maerlii TaxID=2231648 RepID=UPI000E3DD313